MAQEVRVQRQGYVETVRIETDAEIEARVWADFDLRAAVIALVDGSPTDTIKADLARRLTAETTAKADAAAKRQTHGLK